MRFTKNLLLAQMLLATALFVVASAANATPQRYVSDPHHTFATVEVRHFGTSTVRVRFDHVDGFVVIDRDAKTGRADFTVDTKSVSSGIPEFDAHLRNADFLDVERWPTARFVGSEFSFDGDRIASVAGELTLLGKTHPIRFVATNFNCYDSPIVKAPVCGGDFDATIERSQWGMNWGVDRGVPDRVHLVIQVEAIERR